MEMIITEIIKLIWETGAYLEGNFNGIYYLWFLLIQTPLEKELKWIIQLHYFGSSFILSECHFSSYWIIVFKHHLLCGIGSWLKCIWFASVIMGFLVRFPLHGLTLILYSSKTLVESILAIIFRFWLSDEYFLWLNSWGECHAEVIGWGLRDHQTYWHEIKHPEAK